MPQSPFQADQFQVDPSSGDTLTITRDTTDGSLKFVDALVTGGITLSTLIGMQALSNVSVVGNSLVGASHTTIQSAIDDVLETASDTSPHLILITSGVYQEDVLIEKSGVILYALGYVCIQSATATDTLTIQENTTIPEFLMFKGIHFQNVNASQGCVRIIGSATSDVGSNSISFVDCSFSAPATGYPIRTSSVGKVSVRGGNMTSSNASSFCLVEETASFSLMNVKDITALQLDYDNTGDLPSVVGSSYRILDCNFNSNSSVVNSIVSNLTGLGSLFVSNVSDCGAISLDGDQTHTFSNCILGNIVSANTVAIVLKDCKRGTASGSGTLSESKAFGTLTYLVSASETFSFGLDQPDLNYYVLIENDKGTADSDTAYISGKALGSFDVSFSGAVSTTVNFVILRDV